jgi:hypothetical protein
VFANILPAIMRRHGRGPARVHRLAELVARVEENVAPLRSGSREVDVVSVMELWRATAAFARWSKDPYHARLVEESKDPEHFIHNALLLMVASLLADGGLGPELVPTGETRTPDLRLRISARESIDVEVKTPVALQRRPGAHVTPKTAERLIDDELNRSRGQLSPEVPSMLVIGGAFWTAELDEHADACARLLRPGRRGNLVGVILAATTIAYARTRGTGAFDDSWEEVDWAPNAQFRWVANPGYALALNVDFGPDFSGPDISFRPR